jgi:hypothetical protein
MQMEEQKKRQEHEQGIRPLSFESRSLSTALTKTDSTIMKLNIQGVLKAVASIVAQHVANGQAQGAKPALGSPLYCFSEEQYIQEKPEAFSPTYLSLLQQVPNATNVYEFLKCLYDCANFTYFPPYILGLPALSHRSYISIDS